MRTNTIIKLMIKYDWWVKKRTSVITVVFLGTQVFTPINLASFRGNMSVALNCEILEDFHCAWLMSFKKGPSCSKTKISRKGQVQAQLLKKVNAYAFYSAFQKSSILRSVISCKTCVLSMIHLANSKSRLVGIIVFALVVHLCIHLHFSNLAKQNNRKQCSLLVWLWVWPSGSLMTHVLFVLFYKKWGQMDVRTYVERLCAKIVITSSLS